MKTEEEVKERILNIKGLLCDYSLERPVDDLARILYRRVIKELEWVLE